MLNEHNIVLDALNQKRNEIKKSSDSLLQQISGLEKEYNNQMNTLKESLSFKEQQIEALDKAILQQLKIQYEKKQDEPAQHQKDTNTQKMHSQEVSTEQETDIYDVIRKIFVSNKKFQCHRQIVETIEEKYPKVAQWFGATLSKKVSQALNKFKTKNTLIPLTLGKTKKDVFWGSPSWIDNFGNIRQESSIDEKYLQEQKEYDLEF